MGYAGYFSTTARLKDKRSDLEEALHSVPSVESLEILEKLSYNTAVQPTEPKFRKVKLTNNKIKATVTDVPEAKDALAMMGWVPHECENDGDILVLPKEKAITMQHVRQIQEAKEAFVKKQRDLKRNASAASLPGKSGDDTKQRLMAQIEADKKERAGQEPVTKGSVAQKLPSGGITTAGDLGINGGGCC